MMARAVVWALALCLPAAAVEPALIPRPVEMRWQPQRGEFRLTAGAFAAVPVEAREMYLATLAEAAGVDIRMAPADAACAIQFLGADMLADRSMVPVGEGYAIRVLPEVVNVHAATPAGAFHGLQTLAQLLAAGRGAGHATIPALDIVDSPRFGWRGFMLDESRHFSGPEAVKRLLDGMAAYKLNRFHWHLTDSPAWRLEIGKYPQLTAVGARGSETNRRKDAPAEFYTREQVKEIVAYAKARHITVIPEIDMPGHADAAVLSYPGLGGGGFRQKGSEDKWPNFTFNPAKPKTLAFLDDVLAEVAAMFPDAGVIHFGGDEVHFGWGTWPQLPEVKDLMKRENLKDLAGVETWFNRRMAGTIAKLGFTTGGWDEIAARDLPRDKTLVFWWRHDKPDVLRRALDDGYPVVLCPRRPCYFDFVQDDSHRAGRRWGGFNPLADVHAFPDSPGVLRPGDEARVRGIQACLWTETTVTQQRRDFMTWPRLVALAEAAWTPADRKDFRLFEQNLKAHLPRLKARGFAAWNPFAPAPEVQR